MGSVLQPNAVTYGAVIKGLVRTGRTNRALGLLEEWEGYGFRLNVIITTKIVFPYDLDEDISRCLLLSSLCKEGLLSEAECVFDDMIQSGIEPDIAICNSLIDGCCLEDRLKDARKLLDFMVQRGCYPNAINYNTMGIAS
ncbi:hypothetical protein CRG98_040883 [Punica granatum]|uniref:Pentatricopeptide repeat-containing protein n=1 Tax=Punica granatum TaxID=22663 RepID=A0A2I0I530_PUNGR|nr:hypothetical protein CRG98_040883 [Punica granatum]